MQVATAVLLAFPVTLVFDLALAYSAPTRGIAIAFGSFLLSAVASFGTFGPSRLSSFQLFLGWASVFQWFFLGVWLFARVVKLRRWFWGLAFAAWIAVTLVFLGGAFSGVAWSSFAGVPA